MSIHAFSAILQTCAGCWEYRDKSVSGSTGGSVGFTWSHDSRTLPLQTPFTICYCQHPALSHPSLQLFLDRQFQGSWTLCFYCPSPTLADTLKTHWQRGWNPSWLSWIGTFLSCRIVYGYLQEVLWSGMFLLPGICPLLVWRSVPLSLLLTDLLWECFINHPWMILLWQSNFVAFNKVVIGFWSEQCEMRLLSLGVLGVTVLGLCVSLCVYVTCRRNVSRKVFCYHVYSHTWWQRCGLCPVLSWNLGCSSVLHDFLSVMVNLVNLMELRINIET